MIERNKNEEIIPGAAFWRRIKRRVERSLPWTGNGIVELRGK